MIKKNILQHPFCNGNETFLRTGNLICPICNEKYSQHPYWTNSKFVDDLDRDEYYLHILCDGTHVKL